MTTGTAAERARKRAELDNLRRELASLETHKAGKLDDLQSPSAMAVTSNYPTLRGILARAVYRELDVTAKGDVINVKGICASAATGRSASAGI